MLPNSQYGNIGHSKHCVELVKIDFLHRGLRLRRQCEISVLFYTAESLSFVEDDTLNHRI